MNLSTIPKEFRVWDYKHSRWFNGSTSEHSINLQTDTVHYFGEWLLMEGTGYDQNEDHIWRDDPDVHSSIDMLNYLIVLQPIGAVDCHGQRLFEGDLVTAEDVDGILDGQTARIEYDSEYCRYYLQLKDGDRRGFDENIIKVERVCSYFEKPDLY